MAVLERTLLEQYGEEWSRAFEEVRASWAQLAKLLEARADGGPAVTVFLHSAIALHLLEEGWAEFGFRPPENLSPEQATLAEACRNLGRAYEVVVLAARAEAGDSE